MTDNLGYLDPKLYWIRLNTKPIEQGSKPDRYLRSRGINLTRFPRDLREDNQGNMVAIIRDPEGRGVSWHRTCLNDKAECTFKYVAKGEIPKGSAIRLGPVGKVMGAAEGIETALSASILSGKNGSERIPVWSTIDSGKMSSFDPPTGTETYIIFADNDTAGIEAAKSSERNSWAKETMVLTPPTRNQDWNDVLRDMRIKAPLAYGEASNDKESGLERMNAVQEAISKATAKITSLNKLELSL